MYALQRKRLSGQMTRPVTLAVRRLSNADWHIPCRRSSMAERRGGSRNRVVTDAESALGTIESTLESRQPPSRQSARARSTVVSVVGDAADLVTRMRIAVRDHDEKQLRLLLDRSVLRLAVGQVRASQGGGEVPSRGDPTC